MTKLAVNLSMIFTENCCLSVLFWLKPLVLNMWKPISYELSIEQIQTQLTLHDLSLCLH